MPSLIGMTRDARTMDWVPETMALIYSRGFHVDISCFCQMLRIATGNEMYVSAKRLNPGATDVELGILDGTSLVSACSSGVGYSSPQSFQPVDIALWDGETDYRAQSRVQAVSVANVVTAPGTYPFKTGHPSSRKG